jgi:hypothetical protein
MSLFSMMPMFLGRLFGISGGGLELWVGQIRPTKTTNSGIAGECPDPTAQTL